MKCFAVNTEIQTPYKRYDVPDIVLFHQPIINFRYHDGVVTTYNRRRKIQLEFREISLKY